MKSLLSEMSLTELAQIERTFGVALCVTKAVREQLNALRDQPRQMQLSLTVSR